MLIKQEQFNLPSYLAKCITITSEIYPNLGWFRSRGVEKVLHVSAMILKNVFNF